MAGKLPKKPRVPSNEPDRWGQGIEHHPRSEELVRFVAENDFENYDDHFQWKVGGDGDNGESLMYEMDSFFEQEEAILAEKNAQMQETVEAIGATLIEKNAKIQEVLEAAETLEAWASGTMPSRTKQTFEEATNSLFKGKVPNAIKELDQLLSVLSKAVRVMREKKNGE